MDISSLNWTFVKPTYTFNSMSPPENVSQSIRIKAYTCLPFGIAAPAIFQRLMNTILQGVPIDDILVTGNSKDDHLNNLNEVLSWLEKHGFRLKKNKYLCYSLRLVNYFAKAV